MDLSTFFAGKVIDHLLRNQAYTPPAAVYVSLHTADPGLAGSSEVSGGSYARQAVTLTAASSKSTASSGALNFTSMPTAVVSHVGLWDASTAGNFLLGGPAGTINYYATVDAATDVFTSFSHGFTTDDRVQFANGPSSDSIPAGVTAGTVYYVISSGLTSDAFKVSATQGGSTIAVTGSGELIARKVVPKSLTAGDTYQIASGQFQITLV